jgi:glycosyltransferase involved in cell wall biosynthesis
VNVAALNANADLLFSPAPKLLPAGIPAVVTIHDIMTAKLPPKLLGWTSAHRLTAYSWMAAKLSSKIITDSEHSKKDIAETFDIDPEKIAVVYLGYDNHTFNTDPIDIGRKHATYSKYGIARPYIIHHGMVQSRKNILGLIEAYKILCQTRKIDFDLVLAGGFGHGSEEVRRQAAAFSGGTVILTGPLSDDELGVILKGASLAVIPSFYEGFCLPIVEAMACGIPTIGANNSCIPEISGHVLRYFDARSSEEMASAMSDTLESSTLQHNLSVAGLSQASKYSWQRCARETLDAICNTQIK